MKINWHYTDSTHLDMNGELALSFHIQNHTSYARPGTGHKLYLLIGHYGHGCAWHYIDTLPTSEEAQQLAQLLIDNNPQAWEEEP